MNFPEASHPIWPILRVTTRSLVLLFGLWCFYSGLDPRDVKTILLAIFADAGLTAWSTVAKKE